MARIKIEIEDLPNGNVRVTSDPKASEIYSMVNAGFEQTAAHVYALRAINGIKDLQNEITKEINSNDRSSLIIPVPKVKRI